MERPDNKEERKCCDNDLEKRRDIFAQFARSAKHSVIRAILFLAQSLNFHQTHQLLPPVYFSNSAKEASLQREMHKLHTALALLFQSVVIRAFCDNIRGGVPGAHLDPSLKEALTILRKKVFFRD